MRNEKVASMKKYMNNKSWLNTCFDTLQATLLRCSLAATLQDYNAVFFLPLRDHLPK